MRRPSRGRREPATLRKLLILTLAVCGILALVGRSILGDRGLFEVWRKKSSTQRLAAEVQALRDRNTALHQEIEALKHDPLAIERVAREEMGYSRPGEVTFVFREDGGAKPFVTPAP